MTIDELRNIGLEVYSHNGGKRARKVYQQCSGMVEIRFVSADHSRWYCEIVNRDEDGEIEGHAALPLAFANIETVSTLISVIEAAAADNEMDSP